jgi:hypothetical protein
MNGDDGEDLRGDRFVEEDSEKILTQASFRCVLQFVGAPVTRDLNE